MASEKFTNQFIDTRNNNLQDFINYYKEVDLLILDDVQFLREKEKPKKFFHIFNHLHQGAQIIMTSDCPPNDLKGLQKDYLIQMGIDRRSSGS